jgi:hypothetical protein
MPALSFRYMNFFDHRETRSALAPGRAGKIRLDCAFRGMLKHDLALS